MAVYNLKKKKFFFNLCLVLCVYMCIERCGGVGWRRTANLWYWYFCSNNSGHFPVMHLHLSSSSILKLRWCSLELMWWKCWGIASCWLWEQVVVAFVCLFCFCSVPDWSLKKAKGYVVLFFSRLHSHGNYVIPALLARLALLLGVPMLERCDKVLISYDSPNLVLECQLLYADYQISVFTPSYNYIKTY